MAASCDARGHAGDRQRRTGETDEEEEHDEAGGPCALHEVQLGAGRIGEHGFGTETEPQVDQIRPQSFGFGERASLELQPRQSRFRVAQQSRDVIGVDEQQAESMQVLGEERRLARTIRTGEDNENRPFVSGGGAQRCERGDAHARAEPAWR